MIRVKKLPRLNTHYRVEQRGQINSEDLPRQIVERERQQRGELYNDCITYGIRGAFTNKGPHALEMLARYEIPEKRRAILEGASISWMRVTTATLQSNCELVVIWARRNSVRNVNIFSQINDIAYCLFLKTARNVVEQPENIQLGTPILGFPGDRFEIWSADKSSVGGTCNATITGKILEFSEEIPR